MLLLLYYAEDRADVRDRTGGRIVGGTFTRGRWRELRSDLRTGRRREEEEARAERAREAKRAAEAEAAHQALLESLKRRTPRQQYDDLKAAQAAELAAAKAKRQAAQAALAAERAREIERIAAEISARRAEEDRTLAERLKALWSEGPGPQGLTSAELAGAQAFHANRLAKLAKAAREAQEEEEALALLMN
jgi:hypothetical protein